MMLCAICLYHGTTPPAQATTITNGHALCRPHYTQTRNSTDPSGGGPSLHWINRPRPDNTNR